MQKLGEQMTTAIAALPSTNAGGAETRASRRLDDFKEESSVPTPVKVKHNDETHHSDSEHNNDSHENRNDKNRNSLTAKPSKSVDHNDSPTENNNNNNNDGKEGKTNKTTKKKRKHPGGSSSSLLSKEDRILQAKQERYNKLVYMAKKQLMKQAKLVRTFLIQKEIRKLKTKKQRTDGSNAPSTTSSTTSTLSTTTLPSSNTTVLDRLKALSLEEEEEEGVIPEAMRRLGIFHVNPDPNAEFSSNHHPHPEDVISTMILDHAKFQSTLEEWNEKVAEYRRFCLRLDEHVHPNNFSQPNDYYNHVNNNNKKKKSATQHSKKQKKQPSSSSTSTLQELPTSLFCTLNNNGEFETQIQNNRDDYNDHEHPPDDGGEWSAYGPAGNLFMENNTKKKNRKGQRARKAKAMALEAKRAGRSVRRGGGIGESSWNWRSKDNNNNNTSKSHHPEISNHRKINNTQPHTTATSTISMKTKELPNNHHHHSSHQGPPQAQSNHQQPQHQQQEQHPSWIAKQNQKKGIVAFQGTKITF